MKNGKLTLESMNQAVWYNKWTLQKFNHFLQGTILEVGCGIGNFTRTLERRGQVFAIDIDKDHIVMTRKKIKEKDRIGFGDIEKGTYFFKNRKFDNIICLNVLEHIQNDATALKNMYELLNKGGNLVLLVPVHNFLYGEIDKSIGHFRRYNKNALIDMLNSLKFNIIVSREINFIGALGWYIAGKILKNKLVKVEYVRVFNFIAPFILKFEDMVEPIFGTSILIVTKK